jgi:hypothetical protein
MFGFLRRMFHGGELGTLWCSLVHDAPTWPFRQHYECRTCGRQYRVPWAEPERSGQALTAQAEYRAGFLRVGSGSAGAFRRPLRPKPPGGPTRPSKLKHPCRSYRRLAA